jgi:Holliday junction resolvase RusA-like endonuclease
MIFTIPGKPTGKARARTFYNPRLGRTQSVTPKGTVSYENLVKTCYMQAEDRKEWLDKEPLTVYITAYFDIPKSTSKKKRQQMIDGELMPTKKPDIDNIAKIICDALNGVAYKDDTQVVELIMRKKYTDGLPRVMVGIYDFEGGDADGDEWMG